MSEARAAAFHDDAIVNFPLQAYPPKFDFAWFELFLKDMRGAVNNDTTLKNYTSYITRFADWLKAQGIIEPVKGDIQNYKAALSNEGLEAGTQAQYMRAVRHFFKWAAGEQLYIDVSANVKPLKQPQNIHKKDALQREDVPLIADSIDRSTEAGKRIYAMYMLCITCGLRDVELSRADMQDLQTERGRTYLYIQGKGHDSKDAPVLIVPDVLNALREYLESRTDKPTSKSPLFVSTSNRSKGQRIAPSTISSMLKDMLKAAGYDSKRLTAHSLRHTSGTGAYLATHNLYLTQQHQRHVDPATTEIYVHAEERQQRSTEQAVYNFYFSQEETTVEDEAIAILKQLSQEKKKAALDFLKALI